MTTSDRGEFEDRLLVVLRGVLATQCAILQANTHIMGILATSLPEMSDAMGDVTFKLAAQLQALHDAVAKDFCSDDPR